MNDPYKCLQKVTRHFFEILPGCHFMRENPSKKGEKREKKGKKGKIEGISLYKMATGQNLKKVAGNFLKTLVRIIHVKFQTSMTIFG